MCSSTRPFLGSFATLILSNRRIVDERQRVVPNEVSVGEKLDWKLKETAEVSSTHFRESQILTFIAILILSNSSQNAA